jgi:acetylornithine/N-succinyldiaminopimelate aminotransferase
MMVSEKTCSVMLEPVQGGRGKYRIKRILKLAFGLLCEKKILLIFDEIQTGIGRTGKLFGFEHTGYDRIS